MADRATCDVVVVGSGAAGLTAALAAAKAGLQVALLEASPLIGGTTALSEGMIWIPNSAAATALPDAPPTDREADDALTYLAATSSAGFDPERARAYLAAGPQVLEFLAHASGLTFTLNRASRDYVTDAPGATMGRRALNPDPFDARSLPRDLFRKLRPPLPTMMIWGGMSIASRDLADFLVAGRSPGAALRVARLGARHLLDRLVGWPRGPRVANGNAIVARLALANLRAGVDLRTSWPVEALILRDGRVQGVMGPGGSIAAHFGVILATGGYNTAPRPSAGLGVTQTHVALPPEVSAPPLARLVADTGAELVGAVSQPVLWAPASVVPEGPARAGPWPHFGDRAKPGVICVGPDGLRFANEAAVYHDFVPRLIEATSAHPDGPHAWLVADHRAVRRYGLGPIGPFPVRLGPYQATGYLKTGNDLPDLARRIDVPEASLIETVARFNRHARSGEDPDFGRGASAYDRVNGDPAHAPTPCLGSLDQGPFHAIRISPGDIGTFVGLRVDAQALVRRGDGTAVDGLWAAGNAATPLNAGTYPAAGLTIGTAMIFGWIAVRDLLERRPQ